MDLIFWVALSGAMAGGFIVAILLFLVMLILFGEWRKEGERNEDQEK